MFIDSKVTRSAEPSDSLRCPRLSTLLGKSEFDALLAVFQRAVKEKTSGALDALVVAARKTEWQKLPEVIGPLAQYAAPECLEAIATEGVTTDAVQVVL